MAYSITALVAAAAATTIIIITITTTTSRFDEQIWKRLTRRSFFDGQSTPAVSVIQGFPSDCVTLWVV